MSYPDYPQNRLIVDGVDLTVRFQMILLDGYTLSPPELKTYTVDIPGGDGAIDLTQSLTGDVAYKNRQQEFTFAVINPDSFERVKTEVSNFLHGKEFDYQMTMDPGYTYHGRFSVKEYKHTLYTYPGLVGTFRIDIDAQPYKLKCHKVYALNATGGAMFRLPSGRKLVHPVMETAQPCHVRFGNVITNVPAGTYRLNDILFENGYNEIYINSYRLYNVTWSDMKTVEYIPLDAVDNSSVNLIENGGFEYGDFSKWIVDSSWAKALVNDFEPNSGTYKALLCTPISSGVGATIKSSSFEMIAGHTYEVRCAINADKDCEMNLGIYGGGASNQSYGYITKTISIPGGAGNWKSFSVDLVSDETRPDSCLSLGFPTSVTVENNIGIDDCSVKDVTDQTKTGLTWSAAKAYRWDDLQRLNDNIYNIPRKWEDLYKYRWSELKDRRWGDIDFRKENVPDTTVYVKYDWKDL